MRTSALARTTIGILAALASGGLGAQQDSTTEDPVVQVRYPDPDTGVLTLGVREEMQRREVARLEDLRSDFSFSDALEESEIEFVHGVTEDTTVAFKPVHYDHGNGISVADVDADGRLDIYFLSQTGRNELWRNLGDGRFEDITDKAGIGVADRISVAGSFADYDNDGDPDLLVTTVRMGNLLYRNDGKGVFTDVTERAGVGHVGHSSGAIFFDYDNDGRLDCFVTNVGVYTIDEQGPGPYWIGREDAFFGHKFPERTETSILYRNLGEDRFEDVSESTGLVDPGWSGDAAIVDLDGNGFLDLYVLNMQGEDHFWLNQEGKKFRESSKQHFPKNPWGAMGIGFFDYNNDGLMDLILTDMHSDMTENIPIQREKEKAEIPQAEPDAFIYGNAFYENVGEGEFQEISDEIGVENYWPWGLSIGDLNADGYQDVFIASSMSYPFRFAVNAVMLNYEGRRFVDSEFALGVEPRKDGRTHMPVMVLECGGKDAAQERCSGREDTIEVWGTLGTRSSVVFDLDDDGDLDIVTNEFGTRPQVLISDLAKTGEVNFLKIELVGSESNRDGLGARVRVRTSDTEQTRINDGKSGYLSQSSMPLYFGLGAATKVDSIEIEWPSGAVQTIDEAIPVNDLLVVQEP